MTTEKIPLLIDTDPGVDDALALMMAFHDHRHEVVGLTIAAGNVGLSHTVANALKLCEVCGVDVPVYAGAPTPLVYPAPDAANVHGEDGFGDVNYAPATRQAEAEHAAHAILRLSHQYADKLLLVALGPLTNVALALKLDPTLPQRVARCVVMGGAVSAHGNITPAAEFNIHFDPEAADLVFSAFPRIDLVDWEATMAHGFLHTDAERWLAADNAWAQFYASISAHTRAWVQQVGRGERWHAADALAMAMALQPEGAVECLERPIVVETTGRHTRGATVVDWNRQTGAADNARILMRYNQQQFEQQLHATLTQH